MTTSFEETRRAFRALAIIAKTATEAGLSYEEAMAAIEALRRDMNNYTVGRVAKVTIEVGDGEEIEIDNVDVKVEIEQENLDHYSMVNGNRVVTSRILSSEQKSVVLTVNQKEAQELIRLIRED